MKPRVHNATSVPCVTLVSCVTITACLYLRSSFTCFHPDDNYIHMDGAIKPIIIIIFKILLQACRLHSIIIIDYETIQREIIANFVATRLLNKFLCKRNAFK